MDENGGKSKVNGLDGNNRHNNGVKVVIVLIITVIILAVIAVVVSIKKNSESPISDQDIVCDSTKEGYDYEACRDDSPVEREGTAEEWCDSTSSNYDPVFCSYAVSQKASEISNTSGEVASLAYYDEKIEEYADQTPIVGELVYARAVALTGYSKCAEAIQYMKGFPIESFSGNDKVRYYNNAMDLSSLCESSEDASYFEAKISEVRENEELEVYEF